MECGVEHSGKRFLIELLDQLADKGMEEVLEGIGELRILLRSYLPDLARLNIFIAMEPGLLIIRTVHKMLTSVLLLCLAFQATRRTDIFITKAYRTGTANTPVDIGILGDKTLHGRLVSNANVRLQRA